MVAGDVRIGEWTEGGLRLSKAVQERAAMAARRFCNDKILWQWLNRGEWTDR